ncbi:MAG: SPOR domain-containing protein [Gammaproteobacteria bacterium]
MEIGLKERLIGAVVLVILAVIIIPWVLKGGSAPNSTVTKPLALPQATTNAAAPQAYRMDLNNSAATGTGAVPATAMSPPMPAGTAPATAAASNAGPAASSPEMQPPPKPAVAPASAPTPRTMTAGKWIVQAGSYGSEANARSVEHKLAAHGFHAYISRYHKSGRTYYRVRVGPYGERAAAERIVTEVSRAYGGRAQVVPNS